MHQYDPKKIKSSNYRTVRNKTVNQVRRILERYVRGGLDRKQLAYDLANEVKGNRSVMSLFRQLEEDI